MPSDSDEQRDLLARAVDTLDEDALDVRRLGWTGAPDDVRAIAKSGDSIGNRAVDFLTRQNRDMDPWRERGKPT